ncbi:G5 domain-containing protein, partial [Staphylococcus hominis]|uniref:G5 domain-containing protein n=1 Tax=Staphylococcus hominis TaxID=1290 RepID=UPI001F59132D
TSQPKEAATEESTSQPKEAATKESTPRVALYSNDETIATNTAQAPQEFIDQYNATSDRKAMVESMLAENYDSNDVEGIMNNLDVDYNTISANDLFNSIMYAGIEYANQQQSAFTTYAVQYNNKEYNSIDELKSALKVNEVDPNTGVKITGDGITRESQTPAHYTVQATPNKSTGHMDFTVIWKVDKGATESAHNAELGGFQFGNGYNPGNVINGSVKVNGTTAKEQSLSMQVGAKPNYPQGYATVKPTTMTKSPVDQNGNITYKFSVPVKDWNGDLSFSGYVNMFTQDVGGNNVRPDSLNNYFYENTHITGISKPEENLVTKDDATDVEDIPYQIEYQLSKDIPLGEQRTIQEGVNGKRGTVYTVVSYNGEELGRLVKETYNQSPKNKIVALGIGGINNETEKEPLAPIIEPQLSGNNVISGETSPNAQVQITVGGKTYTTTSDGSGRFTTTLPDYSLKQGDHITATATVNGKTSQPGKTIVPRDGRTPEIDTTVVRGVDNNKPGSWVTVTNSETGEQISKFFVPDGEPGAKGDKGEDGKSVNVDYTTTDDAGNTVVHFTVV